MSIFSLSIDGTPVAIEPTFPVHNPSTGEIAGHAPNATEEHLDRAVAAAKAAFES